MSVDEMKADSRVHASKKAVNSSGIDQGNSTNGVKQTEQFATKQADLAHTEKVSSLPVEDRTEERKEMSAETKNKKPKGKSAAKALSSHTIVEELLGSLADVEEHMSNFRSYIKTQKDNDKPLYQWAKYGSYPILSAAVSKLDEAIAKMKRVRLPQEYVAASLGRAMDSSTSVSRATAYALAAMNNKTAKYMEEMESSTLNDEAKANANALIAEELRKLMEHSTQATERVWVAADLLRNCNQKPIRIKGWVCSAVATVMTATIAAVVGIVTAYLYGSAGLDLVPMSGSGEAMYSQILGLVQRTQAITKLIGEMHSIKLQDIDERYNDFSALSESHGLRLDNLVEALGPPNKEGIYYHSTPKTNDESCKDAEGRLQKVSEDAARQMKRLHDELKLMRKNMNRIDIRLTSRLDKMRKD